MLFQRASGDASLASWASRSFSPTVERGPHPGDRKDTYERVVATEPPGPPIENGPHRRAAAAILGYNIFPASVGRGVITRNPVEVGDTVGLRYHVALGIEMFFACRVIERFDEQRGGAWHTGFTYRTLAGHPALGEETFSVEKNLTTGQVMVALRSWSRPGIWMTKLASPFARRAQRLGSRAALRHLEKIATAGS